MTQPVENDHPAQSSFGMMGLLAAQAAQAWLFGIDAAERNLHVFRSFADVTRSAIRQQQDTAIEIVRKEADTIKAHGPGAANFTAPIGLFTPIMIAQEACEQAGAAALAAQRRALESWTGKDRAR
jgi:hypothetical protein